MIFQSQNNIIVILNILWCVESSDNMNYNILCIYKVIWHLFSLAKCPQRKTLSTSGLSNKIFFFVYVTSIVFIYENWDCEADTDQPILQIMTSDDLTRKKTQHHLVDWKSNWLYYSTKFVFAILTVYLIKDLCLASIISIQIAMENIVLHLFFPPHLNLAVDYVHFLYTYKNKNSF